MVKPADEFRRLQVGYPMTQCPLCGHQAELWERWIGDDRWVKFVGCGRGEQENGDICALANPPTCFEFARKQEAIDYWNKTVGSADTTPRAALQLFVTQWNACGPNSEFGRYFQNVRDAAVAALSSAAQNEGGK